MIGYIYKTTNLANGKIYVGMHRVSDEMFDAKYIGSGKILKQAVDKYGKENFSCELLEWCETEQQLADQETFWINHLDAKNHDIGYNLKDGGIGGWNIDVAGKNNPMYGVHRFGSSNPNYGNRRTEESKMQQSRSIAANGGHHGKLNPMYGRKQSEQTREKISAANKGKPSYLAGRSGKDHPCYGMHWWCDGVNKPVKSTECPGPNYHLGRK